MGLEVFEDGALPRWVKVRQTLDAQGVGDVAAAVAEQFARPEILGAIPRGSRVALCGGSRGIDKLDQVLKAAVSEVRRLGADPFIVPTMGSHGGATAEGQLHVLAHYGVTEATMGCPIHSSMETVLLGTVEDEVPVWFDQTAHTEADVVIPVNRVKPHTDFHGPVESGLMKMIAIGLGKQKGADTFHSRGFPAFHHLIPAVAKFTLGVKNIPFGLALVENGHSELACVEAVTADRMWEREQELVEIARARMPRLLGEEIDVLVVDFLGKDISGIGIDTNVINRYYEGAQPFKPVIQRVVVRDLTPDTEGNACGIGLADVVLQQAVAKLDPIKTNMNSITAKAPEGARIPLTVENDRQGLYIALACCLNLDRERIKLARIRDTKHLETFWASEALVPELQETGKVEVLGEPEEITFDAHGMFSHA